MRLIALFILLNVIVIPMVSARDVLSLQQRASFSYEKMLQAEQNVNTLSKVASRAESQLQRAKINHEDAQQKTDVAKNKLEQANQAMIQTKRDWEQASDTLAEAWNRSK